MKRPLPDPGDVAEFDKDLGADFISLFHLLQLKISVYMQKEKEDGIEFAAKDLADVVELIRNNREAITVDFISSINPKISKEFRRICKKVLKTDYKVSAAYFLTLRG